MSPTAIFNRFDLSASNGQHCGEYRVIYHKNNGNRFFLSFEAKVASCVLFCKSIFTKPLVFKSTLNVFSKLLRSCALELSVVALELLRMFVSVLDCRRTL
jgi:hypothetical protein